MGSGYISVDYKIQRSYLFVVVANVGPGGVSRTLSVAYRQHPEKYNARGSGTRVEHMVADTLALIAILSDPANRAPLEAEKAIAEDWYRRSHEPPVNERPSVPDRPQPLYVPPSKRRLRVEPLPALPWQDEAVRTFPFTATCVLLALLRGDHRYWTRIGDVQFQPLSTVFRGDCKEYGLIVLDISDLNSGVKYGIAAFNMRYMAQLSWHSYTGGWDPVEDPPPAQEPDVVLDLPRPRELLSIVQWIGEYYHWSDLKSLHIVEQLELRPLADATSLDYIRPPKSTVKPPDYMVGYTITDDRPPDTKEASTPSSSRTTLTEPPPPVPADIDRAIDDLLRLTQEPTPGPQKREKPVVNIQLISQFRWRLQQRLEEEPYRLGPFMFSSQVLRVAYAACQHLNWVVFNLSPHIITAAIRSDELRAASALSICVDQPRFAEWGLGDLAAALGQWTSLKQVCLVHRPDHMNDDISARFHSHILKQWESDSNHTMKSKTIYSTSAFLTGLRSREYLPSSPTINYSHTSFTPTVFSTIHLFMFDSTNGSSTGYTSYYCIQNTMLTAGDFAIRFLGYLRALGPEMQPDKAILRFAYNWGLWLFPPIRDGSPHRPPRSIKTASSAADELGVRRIPLGFFDPEPDLNSPSSVRLGEVPRGGWVVLVDRRDPKSEWGEDKPFLQYSFVRIHGAPVEIAPEEGEQQPHQQHAEQQQQNQQKEEEEPLNSLQVVGGLTDFLRITVPDTDISTWETRLEVVESDVSTASFETTPSSVSSSTDVSVNTWARRLMERSQQGEETDEHAEVVEQQRLEQELLEAQIGVEEVETEEPCSKVRVMAESLALTLLGRLR
ncbi:Pc16g11800 [Penicillium rubens Wisconsin 54-1255]|uniref:Pc16g11800 protein n=1 Tax=Penicillium rubens (strain ATCC 28089 / DSM 1075 / NRRL 1951 / Wisconsin 54-1255) TaxID=500485 RepID=B6H9T4_PENRW|nr:Pc16g11800 [Penicillium rubens Wisconsin 54-1255]